MASGLKTQKDAENRRIKRSRSQIKGNNQRPRLSVNVSIKHVSAQIIDDITHRTLTQSTSVGSKAEGNLSQKAAWVGEDIAKKAKALKIKQVVFDRGGKNYHGRVKALADAARNGGLDF